jgi:ribulose-phosphate 3-epimerase
VCPDAAAVVAKARENGLQVGLAFNPETGPEQAAAAAREGRVDVVLCMSIHPGYSGQEFMPEALGRIAALRELLPEGFPIQVDGGVGDGNIRELHAAGARLFVAGTAIFGHDDPAEAYEGLVRALT